MKSNPKRKQRREPAIDKEIADRFPNDPLEAVIVVVMLGCIGAGAYLLYLISQGV